MRRGTLMTILLVLTLLPLAAVAGELVPPGDPASGSRMYTFKELYDYLVNGTTPPASGGFQEPSAGPGTTMKTLKELYEDFKALIDQCTATPEQVVQGQTFFWTTGTWGPADGMIPDNGAVTVTPGTSNQAIAEGYHNGSGRVQGDPNLAPANIVAGVTIFNVTGTAPTLDTVSALNPKTIRAGVTIFGVTGTARFSRFWDNGNGTVTDQTTRLMWTKNANHALSNWYAAMQYCQDLDYAGYSDWRLPTREELVSITDQRFDNPALSNTCGTGQWTEGNVFTGVRSDDYWSSTTKQGSMSLRAWCVSLSSGDVNHRPRASTQSVWPVRGGE